MAGALQDLTLQEPCNRVLLAANNVVRLRSSQNKFVRVAKDGHVDALGGRGTATHFRVSMMENDSVVRFESITHAGAFLRISPQHIVDTGKGGKPCHLKINDVAPGVVKLSGNNGTMSVKPDGTFEQTDQVKDDINSHFFVDAIIDPALLGLGVGEIVRLRHTAGQGYVRVKPEGVDAKGGNGPLPNFEVGVVNGNITLKSQKNGKFLAVDATGKAISSDEPGYFTVMFGAADRKVILIVNGHPDVTGRPLMLSPEGQPITYKDATKDTMLLTDRFTLEAPLAPMFFGLKPKMSCRLHNVTNGKCVRLTEDGEANVAGAMGKLTKLTFHQGANPLDAVFESANKPGSFLRAKPDNSGIDGKGKQAGPRAQIKLVNAGDGKFALRTVGGYIHPDKAPQDVAAMEEGCLYEILAA
eukprot:TRINITY_DN12543_c1_g1_i1.p2 TRINITY_DN12543_c1_g1~~TRINITY_DN12543_c1_g1_i1.p2  ORF type:complete len:413 (+),score=123.17 TRINITY_DN12543_c1_g1_i1:1354-2592(+)